MGHTDILRGGTWPYGTVQTVGTAEYTVWPMGKFPRAVGQSLVWATCVSCLPAHYISWHRRSPCDKLDCQLVLALRQLYNQATQLGAATNNALRDWVLRSDAHLWKLVVPVPYIQCTFCRAYSQFLSRSSCSGSPSDAQVAQQQHAAAGLGKLATAARTCAAGASSQVHGLKYE